MKVISIPIMAVVGLVISGSAAAQKLPVFDTPVELPAPVNVAGAWNYSATTSPDGLTMYFSTNRNGYESWIAERAALTEPFSNGRRFSYYMQPEMSDDGLSMVMNTLNFHDIVLATRSDVSQPFGSFRLVGSGVNTAAEEYTPSLSPDGLELYFVRYPVDESEPGEIWVAARPDLSSVFGDAEKLPETVNLPGFWGDTPTLSPDGLALFFASDRPGGLGCSDLWVSFRADTTSSWSEPLNLGAPVNTSLCEWNPDITADGGTMYFTRSESPNASEGMIWSAAVVPEPDSVGMVLLGSLLMAVSARGRWRIAGPMRER